MMGKMNSKKDVIKRKIARMALTVAAVFNGAMSAGMVCLANGTTTTPNAIATSVTGPMNQVISVVLSVLAVVGVFMLVKSVAEHVNSIQEQDNSGIFRSSRFQQ